MQKADAQMTEQSPFLQACLRQLAKPLHAPMTPRGMVIGKALWNEVIANAQHVTPRRDGLMEFCGFKVSVDETTPEKCVVWVDSEGKIIHVSNLDDPTDGARHPQRAKPRRVPPAPPKAPQRNGTEQPPMKRLCSGYGVVADPPQGFRRCDTCHHYNASGTCQHPLTEWNHGLWRHEMIMKDPAKRWLPRAADDWCGFWRPKEAVA